MQVVTHDGVMVELAVLGSDGAVSFKHKEN